MKTEYIQVILPLRLEWEPCYCLAGDDIFSQVQDVPVNVGDRVRVKFAGRVYVAVVSAVDVEPDIDPSRIEPVLESRTGFPPVGEQELSLWRFVADYYMCTVGEVYKAAYPIQRIASEQVQLEADRRKQERMKLEVARLEGRLSRLRQRLAARETALNKKHSEAVTVRLLQEKEKIMAEIEDLSRAQSLTRTLACAAPETSEIEPACTASETLIESLPLSREPLPDCCRPVLDAFSAGKPVLLQTSGTRIDHYRALAAQTLRSGRNVLLLVPETGLAKSLQAALEESFPGILLVFHSDETQVRRRRIADAVRSGRPYLLLGTRSSLFLPFANLGLVIVEGEQSQFYKQSDSAPRYNGRDVAVVLGRLLGANVLLGTSSPSLETLLNARTGKYVPVSAGQKTLPADGSEVIDTKAERRKNGMLGCISRKLAACVRDDLRSSGNGKILFIRGFEKQEDALSDIQKVFGPDSARIQLMTIPEASRIDLSAYLMVAMLSADALMRPDDFRSDEHAFQFLERLRGECGGVVLQTGNADLQVFSLEGAESLLGERELFGLPPYARLVDVLVPQFAGADRLASMLSESLIMRGFMCSDAMPMPDGKYYVRVTLRRDARLSEQKKALSRSLSDFVTGHKFRGNIQVDVDPV